MVLIPKHSMLLRANSNMAFMGGGMGNLFWFDGRILVANFLVLGSTPLAIAVFWLISDNCCLFDFSSSLLYVNCLRQWY